MDNLQKTIQQKMPALLELFKNLHAHPELSGQEKQTSKKLAGEFRKIGYTVTERVGNYGVVAVLKNGSGPTVMVRADMDALPITEETGLPYASKVQQKNADGNIVGVMHACGHDHHMTTLLGTAGTLAQLKDRWHGTLIFICQPAEEMLSGARKMVENGLFKRFPIPDYLLALHVHTNLPAGSVGFCSGYSWANVDIAEILIRGKGGHGAYPHKCKDPIVLASQYILALQTIVSREINPVEPAVITVGSIHGGTQHNIIPPEVKLLVTIRTYSDAVRTQIFSALKRLGNGLAKAAGLPPSLYPLIRLVDYTPAVYNDPDLTGRLAALSKRVLGKSQVVTMRPEMGSEDFGWYTKANRKIRLCMFLVGVTSEQRTKDVKAGKSVPNLIHNHKFAVDPIPALQTGIRIMSESVLDLMK